MLDPARVCLFVPPDLKTFKLALFERIGAKIKQAGGMIARKQSELAVLPPNMIPIVGCTPELRPLINGWRESKRRWIYWDRGYMRRVFATWLERGEDGGYYRWHLNSFQMQSIRDVPSDRFDALHFNATIKPWQENPDGHILIACPTPTYAKFHGLQCWTEDTIRTLSRHTDKMLVVRDKETKRPLQADLSGAYCCVAHGSMAAVEAVMLGCPVIVDPSSAAALVGITDLNMVAKVKYPDRTAWLRSLAYCQFNERELVDGTLWKLIE